MAVNEILFKELPFRPDHNQVFYIENGYDTDANDFIRSNYFDLKSMFAHIGLDFYYLPYLLREHDIEAKVRYYAPYLSPKLLVTKVQSNAFVQYISDIDTKNNLKPSFIFEGSQEGYSGDTRFLQIELSDYDFTKPDALEGLIRSIAERREAYYLEMKREEVYYSRSTISYERRQLEETDSCEMSMPSPSAAPSFDIEGFEEERSARHNPKASKSNTGMLGRILRRFGLDDDKRLDASDDIKSKENGRRISRGTKPDRDSKSPA